MSEENVVDLEHKGKVVEIDNVETLDILNNFFGVTTVVYGVTDDNGDVIGFSGIFTMSPVEVVPHANQAANYWQSHFQEVVFDTPLSVVVKFMELINKNRQS